MAGRFTNRVVLVTGGAAGIGRSSALAFAREGAAVMVCDLNADAAAVTVDSINAGIEGDVAVPIAEASEATWDRIIDVILKSVWLCMKYQLAHMQARRTGSIVNTASAAVDGGFIAT